MACGRGPGNGGAVCIAATESRLDGVHGGINAGRACWVIAGTMCNGCPVSGTFAQKMDTCFKCLFYRKVKEEEPEFIDHWTLLLRTR